MSMRWFWTILSVWLVGSVPISILLGHRLRAVNSLPDAREVVKHVSFVEDAAEHATGA